VVARYVVLVPYLSMRLNSPNFFFSIFMVDTLPGRFWTVVPRLATPVVLISTSQQTVDVCRYVNSLVFCFNSLIPVILVTF
jgi:hypothetical protein